LFSSKEVPKVIDDLPVPSFRGVTVSILPRIKVASPLILSEFQL
jgi:hypothetical protein